MSEPVYKVGDPAPPPLPRRSEAEVMARWQGDEPVVSILCPTYQHVGFIEDALCGFLGQDTDFPFEILVRDDASTDGTAEIVRDYAERYPNIVRAVLETENRYPEVKASQVLGPMARGDFIALCEGDDYWIDSGLIHEQVRLLREDEAAVSVHADCLSVRHGTVVGSSELASIRRRRSLSRSELLMTWYLPVRGLLYRSLAVANQEQIQFAERVGFGDNVRPKILADYGHSILLDREPGVVRRMHCRSLTGVLLHRQTLSSRLRFAARQHYASAIYSLEIRNFRSLAYWISMSAFKYTASLVALSASARRLGTRLAVLEAPCGECS